MSLFLMLMSDQFDMIFGQYWLRQAKCTIDHVTHCLDALIMLAANALLPQVQDANSIQPIVSAMHLEEDLHVQDLLYALQVRNSDPTAAQAPAFQGNAGSAWSVPDDACLIIQALLERRKYTLAAELPAKLPPDCRLYRTILLKKNELPPPRRTWRLSRPEAEALKCQGHSLLAKCHVQPGNSPYGHPVLLMKKATGGFVHVHRLQSTQSADTKDRMSTASYTQLV